MTPADLLTALADRGITVNVYPDDKVSLVGSPKLDLLPQCREHRWLFTTGAHTGYEGHRWHGCDTCGAVQVLHPRRTGRACIMTYECQGKMADIPSPSIVKMLDGQRRVE